MTIEEAIRVGSIPTRASSEQRIVEPAAGPILDDEDFELAVLKTDLWWAEHMLATTVWGKEYWENRLIELREELRTLDAEIMGGPA